jgi:predicted Zn-dependent peptidase
VKAAVRLDRAGDPELNLHRFTLPSGLDVVVHPDRSTPQVAVSVWYRVGSSDERPDQSGHAHLFEHLFKNSEHLAGKLHYEVLRRAGAADANASTGADRTAYHAILPAEQLDLALWIESDRMGYLLPGLSEERVAQQRAVVLSERRQRYENVPYGAERFATAEALYPDGHPLRHLTIGRRETIAAATRASIVELYRTWYVPSNATLVIAGDVTPARARARVERWFGSFPASRRPSRPTPALAPLAGAVRVALDDPFAKIRRVRRVWRAPAAFAADEAELDTLAIVLALPGTGALWRALVYDRPWAQRVSVSASSTRLGGELHVAVDLRGEAEVAAVRDVIDQVLDGVRRGDPAAIDERAVARARTRREAGFVWRLEGLGRRVQAIQRYALYQDDPGGFAADLRRYRAVTLDGVIAAANRWMTPDRWVEVETRVKASQVPQNV